MEKRLFLRFVLCRMCLFWQCEFIRFEFFNPMKQILFVLCLLFSSNIFAQTGYRTNDHQYFEPENYPHCYDTVEESCNSLNSISPNSGYYYVDYYWGIAYRCRYHDPAWDWPGSNGIRTVTCDSSCPEGQVRNSITGQCGCPPGDTTPQCRKECPKTSSFVGYGESCPDEECIANPIYLTSGNKVQPETDVVLAQGEFPLSFTRTYQSNSDLVGLLGNKWYSPFYFTSSIDATTATLQLPSGLQYEFTFDGSIWVGTNDSIASFVTVGSDYELRLISGEVYSYNATGELQTHTNANGLSWTFSYTAGQLNSVSDAYTNTATFTYTGTFIDTISVAGFVIDYNYTTTGDGINNLEEVIVTDPDATTHTRQYLYTDTSFPQHLTGITDEGGNTYASWSYDNLGRAITSEHAGSELVTLDYQFLLDSTDPRTVATNQNGRETIYHLSNLNGSTQINRVEGIAIASCAAADTYYSYDATAMKETKTDPEGNVTRYTYYTDNRINTKTTGLRWLNDINTGLVADLVDTPTMQRTTTVWHATSGKIDLVTYEGRAIPTGGQTIGDWQTYQTVDSEYFSNGRLQSYTVTDNTGFTTPYSTNGNSRTWTYAYTYHNVEETVVDTQTIDAPLSGTGDTSTVSYDAQGRLTSSSNALSHTTTYSDFNATGLAETVTDPNGMVTTLAYDGRNRLTDSWAAFGTALQTHTQIDYYANGLVERITTAEGSLTDETWVNYTYNNSRHLTLIANKAGDTVTLIPNALDGQWTVREVKNSSGLLTQKQTKVFDELGRLIQILDAAGVEREHFDYDRNDQLTGTTQGASAITEVIRLYDALGRIQQMTHADDETSAGGAASKSYYRYDPQGNLSEVTDQRGLVTTYQYDGFSNLMQTISPDTGTTSYLYDAVGNRTKQTDARAVVTDYTYDVLNRLTDVTYPTSSLENITYEYDDTSGGNKGIGRMTAMIDNLSNTTWVYNALGQLSKKVVDRAVWTYSYDLAGNLMTMTYPSGRSVRYVRDTDLGRIIEVHTAHWPGATEQLVADTFSYLPFGSLQSYKAVSGVEHTVNFDDDYRVKDIQVGTTATPTALMDWTYDYYQTSNISLIDDNNNTANDQTFSYDAENRLNVADGSYGVLDYDYDKVGNRTKLTVDTNALVKDYTYDTTSNQLDTLVETPGGTTTFNYSASGQQTNRPNATSGSLTYNDADRVRNMSGSNAGQYDYNGLGQRVRKQGWIGGEGVYLISHFNRNGQLIAEYNRYDVLEAEYIYADGTLLTIIRPDATSDSDGDGIDDDWETQHAGNLTTFTDSTDTDGDGLLDIDEFSLGYNPTDQNDQADTDGDGLSDLWELMYFNDLDQDETTDFNNDGVLDIDEFINITDPTLLSQTAWLISVYGLMQ
jgi:YD repeat-containing protein